MTDVIPLTDEQKHRGKIFKIELDNLEKRVLDAFIDIDNQLNNNRYRLHKFALDILNDFMERLEREVKELESYTSKS